jgi:hypothetical protein
VGSDDEILTAVPSVSDAGNQLPGDSRRRHRQTGSTATTPPRNGRVGYREATTTLESMTIWLTRF